jgi:hypothetical protein
VIIDLFRLLLGQTNTGCQDAPLAPFQLFHVTLLPARLTCPLRPTNQGLYRIWGWFHAAGFNRSHQLTALQQYRRSIAIAVCHHLYYFESCKLTTSNTSPLLVLHLAAISRPAFTSSTQFPNESRFRSLLIYCYLLLPAFHAQIVASMPATLLSSLALPLTHSSSLSFGSSSSYPGLTVVMFTLSYPASRCRHFESEIT